MPDIVVLFKLVSLCEINTAIIPILQKNGARDRNVW